MREGAREAPFWMVYGVGQGAPRVRHHRFEAAEQEARRLAGAHPGIEFLILRAVARAVRADVTVTRIGTPIDDEIPF